MKNGGKLNDESKGGKGDSNCTLRCNGRNYSSFCNDVKLEDDSKEENDEERL